MMEVRNRTLVHDRSKSSRRLAAAFCRIVLIRRLVVMDVRFPLQRSSQL